MIVRVRQGPKAPARLGTRNVEAGTRREGGTWERRQPCRESRRQGRSGGVRGPRQGADTRTQVVPRGRHDDRHHRCPRIGLIAPMPKWLARSTMTVGDRRCRRQLGGGRRAQRGVGLARMVLGTEIRTAESCATPLYVRYCGSGREPAEQGRTEPAALHAGRDDA